MRWIGLLAGLAVGSPAAADHHWVGVERACAQWVQGRIAWNDQGETSWRPENLERLCRGTRVPEAPGRCFDQVMWGGVDWGGGRRWEWENALSLCRGTSDAAATIGCFRRAVGRRVEWPEAIDACAVSGRHSAGPDDFATVRCQEWVQGRIPWNHQGDRIWADVYLNRLCAGSRYPEQPGRCYDEVMHGGLDWGGGTRWEPDNALALCAGSEDARGTIACFRDAVRRGQPWQSAIRTCGR